MRALIGSVLALWIAACVDASEPGAALEGALADGYTLEIRADASEQVFLVTTPEGRIVGARAAGGASALMETGAARALAGAPAAQRAEAGLEVFSLRLPGLDLSVSGEEEGGRVSIDVAGHTVQVEANEGGPGDLDDRAYVRIAGVPEAEVREFIATADPLSPQVQAQMLAELGLD